MDVVRGRSYVDMMQDQYPVYLRLETSRRATHQESIPPFVERDGSIFVAIQIINEFLQVRLIQRQSTSFACFPHILLPQLHVAVAIELDKEPP